MKETLLTIIVTTLIAFQALGQQQFDIKNHYEDFISIQKVAYNSEIQKLAYNSEFYLEKLVVKADERNCVSDLINNNTIFLDYLLTSFSSNAKNQDLLQLTDSIALRKAYFQDLKNDSLFNAVMAELVSKSIDQDVAKDTVTMDKLLNIAVKYFSVRKIDDEGYYVGKICVGANDIRKTETERKPFVEAFCFSSIMKHFQGEQYNMYDEFVKGIKELYKVNLGTNNEEKLLRAQGAIFLLMRNNEVLKRMLKAEYDNQKEYLPFVLVANNY